MFSNLSPRQCKETRITYDAGIGTEDQREKSCLDVEISFQLLRA